MFMWKRKAGEGVVIGDDSYVTIASVTQSNGEQFRGVVTLGFEVPEGTLVQREETYRLQNEAVPFPQFYRCVRRDTGSVMGYALELPAEASLKSTSYQYEMVAGYEDINPDIDRQVVIFLFRQESEADACIRGLESAEVVGVEIGFAKAKRDNNWALLMDFYRPLGYKEDPNPLIRSFAEPNTRVMEAINSNPRRRTA